MNGTIRVLDASDNSDLGVVATNLDGFFNDWRELSAALPAAALGKSVLLEFQFVSDDLDGTNFGGWFIDNVAVRAE